MISRTSVLVAAVFLVAACDGSGSPARDEAPETGPGWWNLRRAQPPEDSLTTEEREEAERLAGLGYVSGSVEPATEDVITVYDRDRAGPGWNLYNSGHAPEAVLMDMEGNELHRWSSTFATAWPEAPIESMPAQKKDWWRRVRLFENGDLLAIFEGVGLIKLDRDSNLLWARRVGAHHDLQVRPDGRIYVLSRLIHVVPSVHPTEASVEDLVLLLDAQGRELERISLLSAFESAGFDFASPPGRDHHPDIFHTNTLDVLDGSIADELPQFAAGNLLLSMRTLDRIAVLNPETKRIVWTETGSFRKQHDPKILTNGNMLLFDNMGREEQSAVIEFDPATMQAVWEYRGSEAHPFYTEWSGVAERLGNGNTLITESDYGRVFEVTPEGEIVWEFHNPHRAGKDGRFIATIPELVRLPADYPLEWLD